MTEQSPTGAGENGKVLAISALTAGLAGGVSVVLNGRRRKTKQQRELAALIAQSRAELAELNSTIEGRRKELSSLLTNASRSSRRAIRNAEVPVDFSNVDWSGISRRARKGLERARDEAVKRAPSVDVEAGRDALQSRGADAAKSARSLGDRIVEEVAKRGPELLSTLEQELAPRAKTVASKAADVGEAARHKVDEVRPQLEDLASRARDEASPRIDDLTAKAKSAAAAAPDAFAHELHRAEEALGAIASGAQHRASDVVRSAEIRTKQGAEAVKDGTKEGTSFLFWVSAAAGVIYVVVFNDEQRASARKVIGSIIREARSLYSDIQGKDGTF